MERDCEMDETPQTQQHYGHKIGSLPRSNSRWEKWLGIFFSFLLGAVSSAFFVGGKSRDLSELLIWKGEVTTRIDKMEREGTERSRWVNDNQTIEITANRARIATLETRAEQRGEVINVLQGKVERLENDLKDIKQGNRK